jgi:hypothetical protein
MFVIIFCGFDTLISSLVALRPDISCAGKSRNMARHPHFFHALIISLLLFSTKCFSTEYQRIPTLNFGYSEFAPYTFTTDKGLAVGEVSDIVQKVADESGFEFVAVSGSNRRLFRSLLTSNIDLLMVVPFENKDSDKLIFGEKAFDMLEIAIFWLEGKAPAIKDINQLQSTPIIAIAGYSYGGLFRGDGALVNNDRLLLETHDRALKALFLERAPYLLAYKKPTIFYLEPELKVELSSYLFESIPLVLSIRRSYPNADDVLKTLEKKYAELFPERFQALNPKLPAN